MQRREFLTSTALAASLAFSNRGFARDPDADRIHKIEGYTIDAEFEDKERQIITMGLGKFYERFLQSYCVSDEFRKNAGSLTKYVKTEDFPDIASGKFGYTDRDYMPRLHQRMWYKFCQEPALGLAFPHIKINFVHEPEKDFVAQALPGTMRMFDADADDPKHWEGHFEIDINDWFVANRVYPDGFKSDYWAGVIAHELLHNLGHLHLPDRDDKDYYRYQLILWEMAVMEGRAVKYGSKIDSPTKCRRHPRSR